MKKILLVILTITSLNFYAQVSFEKGYFIDNNNQKTECLIKNLDWRSNPTMFEYKLTETGDVKEANIKGVQEFEITNDSKYVRAKTNIDRSSEQINRLSYVKSPEFNEETLFLQVLLEGQASLFSYIDGNLTRFFYQLNNASIDQLVFKTYRAENNQIKKNNRFKQQLWNDLKCSAITMNKVEQLEYSKNNLTKFFIEYNQCVDHNYTDFVHKEKKDLFNLTLRPGLNSSDLRIRNTTSWSRDTQFDRELAFRFGIEAEVILPFNKNKWGLFIEPTYQYYKSEKVLYSVDFEYETSRIASINYQSIEIPIGIRHYFFLNEDSKLFIDGAIVFDIANDAKIEFEPGKDLDIVTRNNFALGLGYKFKDKYSVEFRYLTSRDILSTYTIWYSDYNTFSFILGYSLF